MVDSLTPLPPINARVTKAQVTEKDPHHQGEQKHKQKPKKEEVQDEISIEALSEENKKDKNNSPPPAIILPHKIDIEV